MGNMRVGIVGFGTVGQGVARLLLEGGERFAQLSSKPVLAAVADVDWARKRQVELPSGVRREKDGVALAAAGDIDVVVELIGGASVAYQVMQTALEAGKFVVTANKALLAEKGAALFKLARKKGVAIGFEGSVCGGIPIIRAIRTGLIADKITAFKGIVNGTCNYILSRMYREGASYGEALKQAQEAGYAEADPSLDVKGIDSAHKLVLLAGLAFGCLPAVEDVRVKGIDGVAGEDVAYAKELGYVTKLIAAGERRADGALELSVYPTLLPAAHPLAAVNGALNAVWVESDAVGTSMYYGPGAGMMPTASAVVSDIVDVATGSARHEYERLRFLDAPRAKVSPFATTASRYYLRFAVKDEFGVLGRIAGILGKHRVSIASVMQKEWKDPQSVPIVMLTHAARDRDVTAALEQIAQEPFVAAPTSALRMDDEESL